MADHRETHPGDDVPHDSVPAATRLVVVAEQIIRHDVEGLRQREPADALVQHGHQVDDVALVAVKRRRGSAPVALRTRDQIQKWRRLNERTNQVEHLLVWPLRTKSRLTDSTSAVNVFAE